MIFLDRTESTNTPVQCLPTRTAMTSQSLLLLLPLVPAQVSPEAVPAVERIRCSPRALSLDEMKCLMAGVADIGEGCNWLYHEGQCSFCLLHPVTKDPTCKMCEPCFALSEDNNTCGELQI